MICTALGNLPHVHICDLTTQTGASLVMQSNTLPYHPNFVKPSPSFYVNTSSLTSSRNTLETTSSHTNLSSNLWHAIPPFPWMYNKTKHLLIQDLTVPLSDPNSITHLISEVNPDSKEGVWMRGEWELVYRVKIRTYVGVWKLVRELITVAYRWPWEEEDMLWIYERRWDREEVGIDEGD